MPRPSCIQLCWLLPLLTVCSLAPAARAQRPAESKTQSTAPPREQKAGASSSEKSTSSQAAFELPARAASSTGEAGSTRAPRGPAAERPTETDNSPAPPQPPPSASPTKAASTSHRPPHSAPQEGIEACFFAFEQSQVHLKHDELKAARALASQCSKGCPAEITIECRALLSQAERDLPTVLLLARTEKGTDAENVNVYIDGRLQHDVLSRETPLDPGPHTVRFTSPSGFVEVVDLLVHKSEKRRQVRVIVPHTAPNFVGDRDGYKKAQALRRWTIASFAVGSFGVLMTTVGGIVAIDARAKLNEKNCAGNCSSEEVNPLLRRSSAWVTVADIGLVVGAVGIGTGTGLLLWKNGKKRQASAARLGLAQRRGGFSAVIDGRF